MKKFIQPLWIKALAGAVVSILLLSFSNVRIGAHSFQVYLDDKPLLDQFIDSRTKVPNVKVDPAKKYNQLTIKYNECGRTVTGRAITIKNDENKVLKEWHFEGAATGYKDPMVCSWKDIMTLTQKGSHTLKLYYSSKDFPEGQQLAYLIFSDDTKTVGKK